MLGWELAETSTPFSLFYLSWSAKTKVFGAGRGNSGYERAERVEKGNKGVWLCVAGLLDQDGEGETDKGTEIMDLDSLTGAPHGVSS